MTVLYFCSSDSDDVELVALLLKILRFSCTKHEENRVKLVACSGISKVLTAAEKFKGELI